MTLEAGTRLGPYEIVAAIGAGGMGEVYRAKDARLDRDVAIKVLPPHVADDADARARFEREARAISQLSHPHICALYDVGRENDVDYLVLEYLEGQTLAERLQAGPLKIEESLKFAVQMAEALDMAHRRGIIHRDLKPGNVMLTKTGAKLLDFGLAKATGTEPAMPADLTSAPTRTTPLTAQGTILGTFQYMAPEQIEGAEADARSDIWAFGCVLSEMLTGRRTFSGKTHASLIGAILKDEPAPVSSVQPDAPPALDRIIRTCLAKDPDDRFQTAHDLLLQLRWTAEGDTRSAAGATASPVRASRERLAWSVAAVATLACAGLGTWLLGLNGAAPDRELRLSVPAAFGGDAWLADDSLGYFAIDPAGTTIVMRGAGQGARLYIRRLDESTPTPLPGTEGGYDPFFSPDGQWVGFWANSVLKKVRIGSGEAVQLIPTQMSSRGSDWGDDGFIYFSALRGPVQRIPEDGGKPEPVTELRDGELSHRWPHVVHGHGVILYTTYVEFGMQTSVIYAERLATHERRVVAEQATDGQFAPPGHVVFARSDSLAAVPFDPERLAAGETARPIFGESRIFTGTGLGAFAVSDSGILVYRPGDVVGGVDQSELVWVDRSGRETPASPETGSYSGPRLSPDGTQIALEQEERDGSSQIWVYDTVRGTMSKRTTEGSSVRVVWTPDGRSLTYGAARSDGTINIFQRPADGSGSETRLTNDPAYTQYPDSWSADGHVLTVEEVNGGLSYITVDDGMATRHPLLESAWNKDYPVISPDGRWLAYASAESGHLEVLVQPFPDLDSKHVISIDGGTLPRWSRDGRQLFYMVRQAGEVAIMAVSVTTTPSFSASKPTKLFQGPYSSGYDVAADGSRFIMVKDLHPGPDSTELRVIVNWARELVEGR